MVKRQFNFYMRNEDTLEPELIMWVVWVDGEATWYCKEGYETYMENTKKEFYDIGLALLKGKKFDDSNPNHWELAKHEFQGAYSWLGEDTTIETEVENE